jgi:hypothetical protein
VIRLRTCRRRLLSHVASSIVLATVSLSAAEHLSAAEPAGDTGAVSYSEQIKPLLAGRCWACHGPDAAQRQADLELHVRDKAIREAIVPGQADASPLVERITTADPDLRMPPADSKKPPLTAAEVALIKRWIDEGARFEGHWSYIAPVRPPQPNVSGSGWVRNPIDRFIAARRDEHGLPPAAEADRRTLVRRLSFDLTGLPPRPSEVEAFIIDPRSDAYERLVDRLLDSPRYGERMAQYWLDVVRYADSGGYHSDNDRQVWLYRDYVIRAFNENLPFDRFTIEQIAGDLLPGATREQRIASGYNRLLQTTEEGGAQAKEYTAKYSADRVRNTATAWLGATMGCCECHDHKFDPYRTRDFYRFAAFFADVSEVPVGRQPQTPLPTVEQEADIKRLDAAIVSARDDLNASRPEVEAAQTRWEQDPSRADKAWTTLAAREMTSAAGAVFQPLPDGVVSVGPATGKDVADKDTYTLVVPVTLKAMTALRLEVLADSTLPAGGPGRAPNGNFVLNEITASFNDAPVKWTAISASHSQNSWPAAAVADGQPETGWAILPQTGKNHELVLETAADLSDGTPATLKLTLHQDYGGGHVIGRFRLSATSAPRPVRAAGADATPPEVRQILAIEPAARSDEQRGALAAYYRTIAPLLQPQREKLAALERQKADIIRSAPTSLVSMSIEPRVVRILSRGNWLDDSGEIVSPGVPEFLPGNTATDRRASRLDLAAWLTSRENPLVARVFVNRLWKLCFGQGIVKTLDDLGTQGAWPSHPLLLDWLAVELIESGWNVKHVLRLMVTSAAYRQSAAAAPGIAERDPANQWWARQGRFRLDAEMVRDNALAISGLLSERIGGPSVKPYQPDRYWEHLNFPTRQWQHDTGANEYRRGLYTWWQRTFLHPSLSAFDAPSREECMAERPRSNTPLQALVLLNDPTYVEAARMFAGRVLRGVSGDAAARVEFAMWQALGRQPSAEEASLLVRLYETSRRAYAADAASADSVRKNGDAPPAAEIEPVELAAWTAVTRAILNLHETITRD